MADSLLQEVDEALRADRAAQWWQNNRRVILFFVVAVILGTAGNSIWQHYREKRGGEQLLAFTESQKQLNAGKAAEAAAGFGAIAEDASGELKALALIWQSRALMADGKKEEAVAALKAAVADGHSLWADIACLRLAGLDPTAAGCLDAAGKSPLAATRAEWAAANLWAKGDTEGAIRALDTLIADKATSPETAARLGQWRASMKAQAPKEAAAKPAAKADEPATEGQE